MLRRSNTSSASLPEVTKRHIERVSSKMSSLLESIEATGSQSHSLSEDQMEVDPLPGIFCDTTMNSSSTSSHPWIDRDEISDHDPEVINSIDDLDRAFDDCLPNTSYPMEGIEDSDKDLFLKPENATMLAPEMPMDPVSPLHKPQLHISHSAPVQVGPEDTAMSPAQNHHRGGLATREDHKHPKSDSGIGSTQGSPGNASLYKEYKGLDYGGSGHLFFGELPPYAVKNPVEEVYSVKIGGDGSNRNGSTSSSSCSVEVSETGANYSRYHESLSQFNEIHTSHGSTVFPYGEPTPPSSAVRSPSTYSSFDVQDFTKTKQLSDESIEAMVHYILNPLQQVALFKDFWGLCEEAKLRLSQRKICWLRDLEKFLFDGVPAVRSLSSYKAFCEAFLGNCQRALPYIRESDQQRSYDPVYSTAYFIDALHRAKESADAWTAEKDRVMRKANHNGQLTSKELYSAGNNKSKLKDFVTIPDMISLESRKRKMSIDTNQDESRVKRALASNNVVGSAQPRLAIQTIAPLGYYDNYHEELPSSPLQDQNTGFPLNPSFDFGPRVLTAVQSGQFSGYTHPSSKAMATVVATPLTSDVSGDHRVMSRHSIGYPQAPTPADTNYSGSPAAPPSSFEGPSSNNNGASRRKASVQVGKPDEEDTPIYYCDQCSREFPRPCDLTKHKKTHERPFKCDDKSCKYHIEGFPTNKERERHQNDIHVANSKEWKCIYSPCTYKSKRESNCKQHMEKAHGYNYKRMKRNPRKRPEQLTKPVTSDKKKRGAIRKTSVATSKSTVSKGTKVSRSSRPETPKATSSPGQESNIAVSNEFDIYHNYPQPPATHVVGDYGLIPGMHSTPYFGGSPTTDYEPSPASMGYNPPMDPYEANPPPIIEDSSEWYPSQDLGFPDNFLSDFGQSSAPYDEGVGDDDTAD
ncbi:hypothetical protein L873DRAFT_1673713 [Choiromyces venosus 120613-1]|uniref:C2H2-type domain-containing protein n=1 Tax=Choiromyces venosus 120613-1 TaxID=1336337 RepID=A0A3N4JV68_9PEZI|nr:hypothetical protein L873DRAFT_1673713 [Choiromyces venosus 120613-1]